MRLLRIFAILAVVLSCAQSQPPCPASGFQVAYSADLPHSSSAHTFLLRQSDGSYTAFQISDATPYPVLSAIPNYQKQLLACPSPVPVAGGSDPEAFARLKSGGYLFVQQPSPNVQSPSGSSQTLPGATINVREFDANLHFVGESHYPLPFSNQYVDFGSLVLVDLNGDGNLDIVEALGAGHSDTQDAYVAILLGTGGAGFATPVIYPVGNGSDEANATSVAIADLNGDGKLDLAVSTASYPQTLVSVLLGNGDGTFQSEQIVSQNAGGGQIAIADFNRDGKPDLACTNLNGGFVNVFLGAGDGTFAAPQKYPATSTINSGRAIAVADVDGDGNPDIVASGISILFGDGKGGFPRRRDILDETSGNIILADFNGDGIADVLVGNGNAEVLGGEFLSVLLAKGGGTFDGPPVVFGASASLSADFNGDGIADLASATQVFSGIGDGAFSAGVPLALPAGCNASAVATADFNHDGHPDLAVICGGYQSLQSIEIFLNNGHGVFGTAIETTVDLGAQSILSVGPTAFLAADFNDDGKTDVALLAATIPPLANSSQGDRIFVLLGNGDGTFGAPISFSPGPAPVSMATGDFNNDGKLDLAVVNVGLENGTGAGVSLFPGNGDGTFAAGLSLSAPPGFIPYDVAAADFNRDGKLDLAVNFSSYGTGIYLGLGNAAFRSPVLYPMANGPLAVGDLNGDGAPDLISGPGYLLGYGDGTFQPYVPISNINSNLIPGDFNRDGKLDVAGNSSIGLVVFLNTWQTAAGPPLEVVSSASLSPGPVAPSSLATIFGRNLAASTASADPTNPPATLGGASVVVQDSNGTTRSALLLYASPDQINFIVPDATASGLATVTAAGGKGSRSVGVEIQPVAPAFFALNSAGLPAAYLVRVTAAGVQTTETIYAVQHGSVVAAPINLGPPGDQVYLVLFGTGIRGAPVGTLIPTLGLGQVTYSGPQPQIPGLDQVNFLLAPGGANQGERILQLQVDGALTNILTLTFQ